jgi:hypothetical protein
VSKQILGLNQAEWSFWLVWVTFSVLSAALAWVVTLPLHIWWSLPHITGVPQGMLPSFVFGALLAGIIVGTGQWIVLRKVVPQAGWWILVSALTAVVAIAVGEAVAPPPEGKLASLPYRHVVGTLALYEATLPNFLLGAVNGTVAGIGQWLVLRKRVQGAGLWILASAAGWAVSNILHGVLYSAITGYVLVLLLRWSAQSSGPSPEA